VAQERVVVRKPILTPEQKRQRHNGRNHRYRKNNPGYHLARTAKRKAERDAAWLLEHPGFTLADRELATAAKRRRHRRYLSGRLTRVGTAGDGLGDFDDMEVM
jgi:hypothetical protein